MKKYILLVVFMFAIGTLTSQAGIKFGVKAGANISNLRFDSDDIKSDNITGFQAGVITEVLFPIVGLGLDGAVLYSQRGLNLDGSEYRSEYIDIPINLKYKIELADVFGIYLAAGPYASFHISGDDNFKKIIDDVEKTWNARTFQAGLNFGAGIELIKKLQVGFNYQWGITHNYRSEDLNFKAKDGTWSITAAYFF